MTDYIDTGAAELSRAYSKATQQDVDRVLLQAIGSSHVPTSPRTAIGQDRGLERTGGGIKKGITPTRGGPV